MFQKPILPVALGPRAQGLDFIQFFLVIIFSSFLQYKWIDQMKSCIFIKSYHHHHYDQNHHLNVNIFVEHIWNAAIVASEFSINPLEGVVHVGVPGWKIILFVQRAIGNYENHLNVMLFTTLEPIEPMVKPTWSLISHWVNRQDETNSRNYKI